MAAICSETTGSGQARPWEEGALSMNRAGRRWETRSENVIASTARMPQDRNSSGSIYSSIQFFAAVASMLISAVAMAQSPSTPNPGRFGAAARFDAGKPLPGAAARLLSTDRSAVLPLLPPGIPPAAPPGTMEPVPQQPPPPATIGDLLFGDNRKTPEDYRSGAFQKLSFTNTYLPRMGGDGFGIYGFELTSVWGLPCPTKDAPLVITPGVGTQWLDGPVGLDIPAQLHEVYTEFRWLPKLGDRFRADIAVQPGFYSDWDGSSDRAIRIMGHADGVFDWSPTFQIVFRRGVSRPAGYRAAADCRLYLDAGSGRGV